MKKNIIIFLQVLIMLSVCFAAEKEKTDKMSAIYVAPTGMIEIDAKEGLVSILPGANIVYETKTLRESKLLSLGFFYGTEGFVDVLNLKEGTGVASETKAKSSSAFVIPLSITTTLTPVRAPNWRLQMTGTLGFQIVIANAMYEAPNMSSVDITAKYFEFGSRLGLGVGMWHDLENNIHLRYGCDFLASFYTISSLKIEKDKPSFGEDPFPETSFFNNRFAISPYIAVGYSF